MNVDLIKRLVAAGVDDAIIQDVMDLNKQVIEAKTELDVLINRRERDRNRKRLARSVRGHPRTSAELPDFQEKKGLPHTPSKEKTPSPSSNEELEAGAFPIEKDLKEAVEEWNELAEIRGLPKVIRLNEKRKQQLRARLRELGSIDAWVDVLVKVRDSSFCCGEHTRWKANFDFVLQPSSMIKIMEGNYDGTDIKSQRVGSNGRRPANGYHS